MNLFFLFFSLSAQYLFILHNRLSYFRSFSFSLRLPNNRHVHPAAAPRVRKRGGGGGGGGENSRVAPNRPKPPPTPKLPIVAGEWGEGAFWVCDARSVGRTDEGVGAFLLECCVAQLTAFAYRRDGGGGGLSFFFQGRHFPRAPPQVSLSVFHSSSSSSPFLSSFTSRPFSAH